MKRHRWRKPEIYRWRWLRSSGSSLNHEIRPAEWKGRRHLVYEISGGGIKMYHPVASAIVIKASPISEIFAQRRPVPQHVGNRKR